MAHGLGIGDATAMNNSPVVCKRNADLEMDKTGFLGKQTEQKIISNIYKGHHV